MYLQNSQAYDINKITSEKTRNKIKRGENMQRIYCYLILGSYCLYAFFYLSITSHTVAALLSAIIILCLSAFFDKKPFTSTLITCYAVTGFFFPEIYLFFPLLVIELGRMKNYSPLLPAAIGLFIHFPPLDIFRLFNYAGGDANPMFPGNTTITLENLCYVLLGCILALFLDMLCGRIAVLEEQYKKTRDDSAELNFLLQDRNRLLIEKQDYEIHTAMLQERNRIAREIHDNAGHMLSRCILLTGMIKTINTDEKCTESIQILDEELTKTMDSIRKSVHDLHREAMNLEEKTRELVADFSFCPVTLDFHMGSEIPVQIKYTFLAITKEALTNITKHSNATQAQIRMTEHPAMYQLVISDNGNSANTSKHSAFSRNSANANQYPAFSNNYTNEGYLQENGIGLQNMQDRVNSLHGTLRITQEKGFCIFITIPKNNERNEENI